MNKYISPKITIITVVFNGEKTIERTIYSVLSQNYNNIEYIIVDGGSNDKTLEIIHKYKQIKLISEKDDGIYDAMNKGIHIATGDFILFLGADDVLLTNETINDVLLHGLYNDALNFGNVYFKNSSMIYFGIFNETSLLHQNVCHQAIFYPTWYLKENNFNLTYKIYADWELNIRALKKLRLNYINIPITLFNETGISSKRKDSFIKDKKKIIRKTLGLKMLFRYYISYPRFLLRLIIKHCYYLLLIKG